MSDIKLISDRISYREDEDQCTLVILPEKKSSRFILISIWLIAFGICGLIVFSQLFMSYSREIKLFFVVFLVFWVYFMLMVGRVWMFMRKGAEMIRFSEGKMTLKRAIGAYGKAHEFLVSNLKFVEVREKTEKSFASELENSFWVLGGQRLTVQYNYKEVRFGIRISAEEAKSTQHLMNKWIKKFKYAEKED